MRKIVHICHRLASFCSSPAKRLRIFREEETEPDFLHLEMLRKKLESTDQAALTLAYSRPEHHSMVLPADTGRRADSFFRNCMRAVRRDIDDILRVDTRDDL